MDFVEPIRDRKKISQIKNLLDGSKRYRDLLLFVVGINSALRISDLLQLQIGDFIDEDGDIRNHFIIREAKRDKRNELVVNSNMREALDKYLAYYPNIGYNYTRSITRVQAWRIVAEMCHSVGLSGNYGTHTHSAKPGAIMPG
jgi:integrase